MLTTPLTTSPELTDLGVHHGVLGDVRDQLLLVTDSTLLEHPAGRTHTLPFTATPGTIGWVPTSDTWVMVQLPDGGTMGIYTERLSTAIELDYPPEPTAEPRGDLVLNRDRLVYKRYGQARLVAIGELSAPTWWVPTTPRWGPGFFENGSLERPPWGRCVEETGPEPAMHCMSLSGRGYGFGRTRHEGEPGRVIACPEGQWLSGSSHVTPSVDAAAAWWCVDHQLRRRGPATYRHADGSITERE